MASEVAPPGRTRAMAHLQALVSEILADPQRDPRSPVAPPSALAAYWYVTGLADAGIINRDEEETWVRRINLLWGRPSVLHGQSESTQT